MAVRADRPEIRDWVEFVLLPNLSERAEMVNVDEPPAKFAIHRFEVEAAGGAGRTVMFKATSAGSRVAFIGVHRRSR
jgi:hypothetical protein